VETNDANEFTLWALRHYNIDSTRVYVTGLSQGGRGTWFALVDAPGLYAAGVPVCGTGANSDGQKVAASGVKVWAFHGSADTEIAFSAHWNIINGYQSKNLSGIIWTVYPGIGHNCWDLAYSDPKLYQWLLKQRR
jgi:predicted peptidase